MPRPDPGWAEGAPVNGGVAADFNVVGDLDRSCLWEFRVAAVLKHISESIAADDRAAMQNHTRAKPDAGVERHAWIEEAIFAQNGSLSHDATRPDRRPRSQCGPVADHCPRSDGDFIAHHDTVADHCCRVDSRFCRYGRMEQPNYARHCGTGDWERG